MIGGRQWDVPRYVGFLVSHVSGNEVVHDFVTLAGADDPRGQSGRSALTVLAVSPSGRAVCRRKVSK